ncbi:MAG: hypothetical protein JWP74_3365 [Marmoricola sp.]|nr:hypothetical protein [Marmoricola sp.]
MTVTVTGGPLVMESIGIPCNSDNHSPQNDATPARLVGPPITVKIQLDPGVTGGDFDVTIGKHAGYMTTVHIDDSGSASVPVPNDGPDTNYTCADENYGNHLDIIASSPDSGASVDSSYYLASVD